MWRNGGCGTEQWRSLREHSFGPGARDQRGGDARAEPAAGRESGMARRRERWHAKRVHRSLRMNPGYDEREGESN